MLLAQLLQARLVGRLQALALAGQALAAGAAGATARRCCGCRRPAPGSAAAPRPPPRCSLARAWRCAPRLPPAAAAGLLLGLGREHSACSSAAGDLPADVSSSAAARLSGAGPLRVLRLQVGQALLGALAAFDHVADALFQPAHLQRRLGQRALRGVQGVAGGVVRLAHGLQLGLDVAQLGQRASSALVASATAGARALLPGRVAVLQEPQLVQLERALVLQLAVARRHLGLLLQLVEVGCSARAGCLPRGSGSRACPSAGSRSRGGAPCTC
jgi:hypothetical protein